MGTDVATPAATEGFDQLENTRKNRESFSVAMLVSVTRYLCCITTMGLNDTKTVCAIIADTSRHNQSTH